MTFELHIAGHRVQATVLEAEDWRVCRTSSYAHRQHRFEEGAERSVCGNVKREGSTRGDPRKTHLRCAVCVGGS